jgi:hypothetical protein
MSAIVSVARCTATLAVFSLHNRQARSSAWLAPNSSLISQTARQFAELGDYDGRRFVRGDQSGRTSAPIRPQAVQTILGHKERTGISSGRASTFITALWWHHPD